MLNGWQTRTAQELDATIRTWAEVFNNHRIPPEHYNECYLRAFDTRQKKLQDGKDMELDATLMVAAWKAGLCQEVEERRIRERRYLENNAASDCQLCFGSGMRPYPEQDGRYGPCDHGNA